MKLNIIVMVFVMESYEIQYHVHEIVSFINMNNKYRFK